MFYTRERCGQNASEAVISDHFNFLIQHMALSACLKMLSDSSFVFFKILEDVTPKLSITGGQSPSTSTVSGCSGARRQSWGSHLIVWGKDTPGNQCYWAGNERSPAGRHTWAEPQVTALKWEPPSSGGGETKGEGP